MSQDVLFTLTAAPAPADGSPLEPAAALAGSRAVRRAAPAAPVGARSDWCLRADHGRCRYAGCGCTCHGATGAGELATRTATTTVITETPTTTRCSPDRESTESPSAMATKTTTRVSDDLDGSTEDVSTVRFALHGLDYEVDLTKAHQDDLTTALEPFLNAARTATSGTGSGRSSSRPGPSTGGRSVGYDAAAVRAWAAAHGIDVSARGRIPKTVAEQYRAAGH